MMVKLIMNFCSLEEMVTLPYGSFTALMSGQRYSPKELDEQLFSDEMSKTTLLGSVMHHQE